jgi:hypothetical protein
MERQYPKKWEPKAAGIGIVRSDKTDSELKLVKRAKTVTAFG